MIVISRRDQGFVAKVPGSPGQFVEGSLQVVESFALIPIELSQVPLVGVQDGADQGELAAPDVFGRHPAVSPDGSVEVGSAVAIDKRHCTTLPDFPLPPPLDE